MNPGVYPVPPGYPTRSLGGRQVLAYCPTSRVVRAPFSGVVRVRAMGAASSGAVGTSPSGSNGATTTFTTVRVRKNDPITVTLGAGGLRQTLGNTAGLAGGTTTITGPGLNISIPPGSPGVLSGNPAPNPIPAGVDEYWLGGLGGSGSGSYGGGGGSPALLEGTSAGFDGGNGAGQPGGGAGVGGNGGNGGGSGGGGGGSGGPAVSNASGPNLAGQISTSPALTGETHCRILVNVSAGAPGGTGSGTQGQNLAGTIPQGGFGGGGGGNGAQTGSIAGGGGRGAGGGGTGTASGAQSGFGGDAFVTLEFQEEV